ncbi:transposase [Actinopolymorpha pittospori]|uniref:Uncharacterized protein n=1 Tax=Actinopolymorpha pittospori TaxID=648752 RepID=A0A927MQ92_9ACTN|nr:hypothetical protein [Actinopolymorpha pittospori]
MACEFSFSTESTPTYVGIADAVDEQLWATAIEDDGIRDGAMVFEATHCVDLSKWPQGTRLILRKERPHPGAQLQLHNTTSDGMRLTAFITDTPARVVPHQIQGLELRHRQHAHVEARIKDSGHLGLGNLPLDAFCHNQAWFEIALAAADLISWACSGTWPPVPTAAAITCATGLILLVAVRLWRSPVSARFSAPVAGDFSARCDVSMRGGGKLAEVAVDGGSSDAELGGDLRDSVQPLAPTSSYISRAMHARRGVSFSFCPPVRPRARAAARPSGGGIELPKLRPGVI